MSVLYKKYLSRSLFVAFLFLAVSSCGSGGGGGSDSTSENDSSATLGAVTGLTVTAGDGQNVVSWSAVDGASYYNLYWEASTAARSAALVSDCSGDSFKGITEWSEAK